MLKDFDEFVNFCFEHGGTLRNHRAFGDMQRKIRENILELDAGSEFLKNTLDYHRRAAKLMIKRKKLCCDCV